MLPKTLGMLSQNNQGFKKISFNNNLIDKKYYKVISSAFQHQDLQSLENLSFSNSNIKDENSKDILYSIPKALTHLDLSNNKLGLQSSLHLKSILDQNKFSKL